MTDETSATGDAVPRGVGATALGVTRLRAIESNRARPLAIDPYAERILEAAVPAGSEWTADRGAAEPRFFRLMRDQVAVRTRFIDDTIARAVADGAAQVVVLGCGMDTRSYRLNWPEGVHVFDLDLPEVLAFRDAVLSRLAASGGHRTSVAADLREDWPRSLVAAGFDPTVRTLWVCEGLLYALPATAAEDLLTEITLLSSPASAVVVDHITDSPAFAAAREEVSPELLELWQGGPEHVGTWLSGHGWEPDVRDLRNEAARYGREIPEDLAGGQHEVARTWLAVGELASTNPGVSGRRWG
ncbi:SAM-dependent methyltransferase [Allokutzneria multivorans]|uniref:SAM-dependent methyltransferase n=1 Tax=Allokutzneria multivorans TaxID=1142134 RepID=UPI0031E8EA28